jgi:hypothetical protein
MSFHSHGDTNLLEALSFSSLLSSPLPFEIIYDKCILFMFW